jgi:hypothetical protein
MSPKRIFISAKGRSNGLKVSLVFFHRTTSFSSRLLFQSRCVVESKLVDSLFFQCPRENPFLKLELPILL